MTAATNLDIVVDVKPVVAGIVRGRLTNSWLDCPFEIVPAPPGQSGVVWAALLFAKDDQTPGYAGHSFRGAALTRDKAKHAVIDVLTSAIQAVVTTRLTPPAAPTTWDRLKGLFR